MKKFAVIVAGGLGVRMGAALPKQFLLLHEHPVIWYTLDTFLAAYSDLRIILVVPVAHRDIAAQLVAGLSRRAQVVLVDGGNTRFHSVRNGLERIEEELGMGDVETTAGAEDTIIFVHDGVRCLASVELVRRCYEQALQVGSAVPVVDCPDSVRLMQDEGASKPIDRSRIKLVQTPQTFRGDILLGAYRLDHQEAFTDEATVVEIGGHAVHLIEGEATNMKITTPTDLIIAEQLLEEMWRRG
jgi:2-C-methyl-D-erythritol 4-phosphate cytidylyltransferase